MSPGRSCRPRRGRASVIDCSKLYSKTTPHRAVRGKIQRAPWPVLRGHAFCSKKAIASTGTAVTESTTSTAPDLLQSLHADWQTVGTLLSEIRAPGTAALPHDCLGVLMARLCARLYVLSQVETELLYPPLEDIAVREAGRRMHERMVRSLHAVLDATAGDEHIGNFALESLAVDMAALQQFEHEKVYPCCGQIDLAAIGDRMVRRREELLSSFNDD